MNLEILRYSNLCSALWEEHLNLTQICCVLTLFYDGLHGHVELELMIKA